MARTSHTALASFLHHVCGLLLTLLFPEQATKYRPEDHYMRGPGPKWRAKHLADHPSSPGN